MMRDGGPSSADRLSEPDDGRAASRGHAERILAVRDRILELIATGRPLDDVLEALVSAIEACCEGSIGSVLLLDDDGERLRHGAAPRLPEGFKRLVEGSRIGPAAGSAGTAAYRGESVVVEDIAADPLWIEHGAAAIEQRLRACWAQPVFSLDRNVTGALAIYYPERRSPTRAEREFVEAVAKLAGIAVDRHAAEQRRRATERRLLRQKTVLVELAKSGPLARSDFAALSRQAIQSAAETLGVERVGVWILSPERTVLRCENLYQRSIDRHSTGPELESSRYPRYFAALERGRSVVAHDARRDPDTSEFAETYLRPLGITSMLDAPIRRAGQLVGVVCHEHVGPRRVWAADEQDFAASVGDFLSLGLEAAGRRRAEQAFRSAQEQLLRQDYQARRQIEMELNRSKDELVGQTRLATIGEVAAGIAHEVRNRLGAIRNAAQRLRTSPSRSEPESTDPLGSIEHEIRRADRTIADLLELSQAEAPVKQLLDLEPIARESLKQVEADERIEFRIDLDPRPFRLRADPDQLRRLLVHLLSNAVEAMGGRGRITLEARRGDDSDEIVVRDTGGGVPAELRARIFEPLVTSKSQGTGLGLSICRQIVDRHGGSIDLVPEAGAGAVFRVRLPGPDGA